jgi:hypothetical protein
MLLILPELSSSRIVDRVGKEDLEKRGTGRAANDEEAGGLGLVAQL